MPMKIWSKKNQVRLGAVLGLAGVKPPEALFVRHLSVFFSWLMLLVSFGLLLQWEWLIDCLGQASLSYLVSSHLIDVAVLTFFIVVYLLELILVKNRQRFILYNWFFPLIIVLGIVVLSLPTSFQKVINHARLLLALYIMLPSLRRVLNFFFDGELRTTILGAGIIVMFFGVLIAGVDPAVKNIGEGMWWALATVSTIGYGDIVPVSPLGRVLGVILVVLGLAIFVIITANILAFVLQREHKKLAKEESNVEALLVEMKELKDQQYRQAHLLQKLLQHLDK
jgi:voltage-gated potassium channel